jgi:hypothetical protein
VCGGLSPYKTCIRDAQKEAEPALQSESRIVKVNAAFERDGQTPAQRALTAKLWQCAKDPPNRR